MQFSYQYHDETYSITLEKQADGNFLATIGDTSYTISAGQVADGAWLLRIDGERILTHTVSDNEARYVHLHGTQFKLEKVDGRRRRSKRTAGGGDLSAEMPGQVIDVRVSEGDSVQSGDVLLVLEAMKMEIRITAPQDGIVAKLLVKTGDVVDRGQLLAEVSQAEL